jgi:dTMP kinase
VSDRYAYSGVCYSVAKGLSFDWCLGADRGLLKPDLVFYIDMSAADLAKRSGYGDERFEKIEF